MKMSANSNEDMSENDYLTELICVLEVEEMSKNFEDAMNINSFQSFKESEKKLKYDNANRDTETISQPIQNKFPRAETVSADRLHGAIFDNVSVEAGSGRSYSKKNFELDPNVQSFKIRNDFKVEAADKDFNGLTNINRNQCLNETKIKQSAVSGNQNVKPYLRSLDSCQNRRLNIAKVSSTDRSQNVSEGAGRGRLQSKYANDYVSKLQCDSNFTSTRKYFEVINRSRKLNEAIMEKSLEKQSADDEDRKAGTSSRQNPIENYGIVQKSLSSDNLHKNNAIPFDVSMGAGRGRLYSESLTKQQVPTELDSRLIEMIGERTEKLRLESERKINFEAMLTLMDSKLDKNSFIENWIYGNKV